jgi:putative NIF3 family GTP cyclohydrolase 1 type 2
MTIIIQDVIDTIIAALPGAPFPKTVDTVTIGDASQQITGIITTFLATYEVIEKTVQRKANLIISHETIFYNHLDETDWLREKAVYQAKRRLIDENNLVVWRFHDYLHAMKPDITFVGLTKDLGWEASSAPEKPFYCQIPPMTLQQLVTHIKAKLCLENVRVIGDLESVCQRVGLLPGFMGRERQIDVLSQPEVDVLICGETHEWETSEYVRDAVHLGHRKALIVIGHAASEEPGMKWIIPWLRTQVPGIPIDFVPTGNLFHWL